MKYLLVYIAFCLTVDMAYVGCRLVRAWRKGQAPGPEGAAQDPPKVSPETVTGQKPKE